MSTRTRRALPDTPVGRQVDWLLSSAGDKTVGESDVEEHFAPSFLANVSASMVLTFLQSTDWESPAEVRVDEETPFSLEASLVVDGEVRALLSASVEETEPHRLIGVMQRPPGPTILDVITSPVPPAGTIAEAVNERFGSVCDGLAAGGIVVGVSRDGSREVFELNADARLVYEIGSITKTFTGLLLAEMAARGEIAFNDPIGKYLPDAVSVPREEQREITLEDLATHSSGLPRLPPNMAEGSDPSDPYAHIDADRLYTELAATTLDFPIGSKSVYSNYGFGLLGHCLSRAVGRPYTELVAERICEPLGMKRTEFSPQGDDLAQGHTGAEPARRWTGEIIAGAGGGFESTIDDMLTYGEANADPSSTPLADALAEAHRERRALDGPASQALGWARLTLNDSSVALFHNGGTAGFSSSLLCHQPTKTVVVALCNSGGASLDPATAGLLASLAS